jgi:hypothetical protein
MPLYNPPATDSGDVALDSTAGDIQPLGSQAAGNSALAAAANHVHAMPTLDAVTAPAGNVAMATHKLTGLGNGSAATDSVAYGQVSGLLNAAPVRFQPANPTATVVTSALVLMGLGTAGGGQACVYTPSNSGLVLVSFTSYVFTATAAALITAGLRYGTYAGPATTVAAGSNGAAQISTIASWAQPSAGVLDVASTAGYAATGTIWVATNGQAAQISYTSVTGGGTPSFNGCAYVAGTGTATIATNNTVAGAPLNGAAVAGTRFGTGSADPVVREPAAGAVSAFAAVDLLSLSAATEYWFDIGLLTGSASDAATVTNISMLLAELASVL